MVLYYLPFLLDLFQSGLGPCDFTKTALVKVSNDFQGANSSASFSGSFSSHQQHLTTASSILLHTLSSLSLHKSPHSILQPPHWLLFLTPPILLFLDISVSQVSVLRLLLDHHLLSRWLKETSPVMSGFPGEFCTVSPSSGSPLGYLLVLFLPLILLVPSSFVPVAINGSSIFPVT